jgi:DNA-binding response OmpR family regulator
MEDITRRILVVDDEDRIRRLLRMYLEKEGYEIDEAEDGETALTMATDNDYALVLLDVTWYRWYGGLHKITCGEVYPDHHADS